MTIKYTHGPPSSSLFTCYCMRCGRIHSLGANQSSARSALAAEAAAKIRLAILL